MSSKIEIPYGPDRKPWSDTLSPLAIKQDGTLLVTPPSSDPEFTYDTSDKERSITPAYYQVPSSRGVRHSVKSRTPRLKSIMKSRNQKPAEIRNHLLSLNYSVKSRKLLHASLPRLISA